MKTNWRVPIAAIATGCILLAVSCKKSETTPSTAANSPYNMYMTDAPGPYQAVNVNITGAAVYSGGVWQNLNVNAGTYNLINLTDGKDTLIASGMVSAGAITQVRLTLAATGNTVVVSGVSYPLAFTSTNQAGLTLTVNSQANTGSTNGITLDFDAGLSVQYNGNSTYNLKPVLRSVIPAVTGTVSGKVSPSTAEASIMVSNPLDTAFSFSSMLSGGFMVQGVAAGNYTITITPAPPYAIKTITNVSVGPGTVTSLGTISLSGD